MEQVKAFPRDLGSDQKGMDLRDYFAAKAIRTVFEMYAHDLDSELPDGYRWDDVDDYEDMAARAYAMADAMLKVRMEWTKPKTTAPM